MKNLNKIAGSTAAFLLISISGFSQYQVNPSMQIIGNHTNSAFQIWGGSTNSNGGKIEMYGSNYNDPQRPGANFYISGPNNTSGELGLKGYAHNFMRYYGERWINLLTINNDGRVGIGINDLQNLTSRFTIGEDINRLSFDHLYGAKNLGAQGCIGFNAAVTPEGFVNTNTDLGNSGGSLLIGDVGGGIRFANFLTTGGTEQNIHRDDVYKHVNMHLTAQGALRLAKYNEKYACNQHADARLSVYGKIVGTSIFVLDPNGQDWCDYVFDENYDLQSLEEVEAYIKANKHLPEIPTTAEVQENGIDLGKMDALLLKKVEEMTLHMIEMKKENTDLKNNLKQLTNRLEEAEKRILEK